MAHRSSLLLLVPDAEPIVGEFRLRHDPAAFAGIGAHITVLFPFMHPDRIDDAVLAKIAAEVATAPLDLHFDRCERFPGLSYLALADSRPTIRLIKKLAAAWPEYPLYEGKHPETVPHLTIAHAEDVVLDEVESQVALDLPLVTHVSEISLFVEDANSRWHERNRFAL